MKIQIKRMSENYFTMLEAFRNYGNFDEVFGDTVENKVGPNVKLGSVRSCFSIGPGKGQYEIGFIKHCEANISKFLAIEPDHASAEHLRKSLVVSLPGAESQVFETKLENWKGLSDPVDLILMFHVLYFVPDGERLDFLKKARDKWLASGGYVAVMHASRMNDPESANMLFERLGRRLPCGKT